MLLSLLYFAVRRMLALLTRGGKRDDVSREIEILVLRHQLRVLARGRRMPLRRRDRLLLAAASELLGRHRWHSFPVSAQTLLRSTSRVGTAQVDLPPHAASGAAGDRRRGSHAHPPLG